jgi:ATP-dependent RNA helicase DeaD
MKDLQPAKGIIFCHSRAECEKVCRSLQKIYEGIDYLHAGLSQDLRTIITGKFRSGKVKFLVATDVASRGLDISGVTHVFIYHLGDDPDVYVHRSGRTGRFEKAGTVVTLVTDRELATFRRILHLIKREPIWIGSPPPEKRERPPSQPFPKRRYYK